ncbi:MAG: 16S rRNA (guanine(527)-N(7))-methyltransferase RsmG [Anaerolineae bacterium]|nr:16S rRNA (guanine(527)-N(7))-methyltransferase RsmG [Anaerolineae bacterium]
MPLIELPQAVRQLLGLELTADQQAAFDRYMQELVEWNEQRANLTAIIEPLAVEMRHFLDSLSILKIVPMTAGLKVIDVGTGAGFPGLPLRIVTPSIKMALMEATGKKAQFLEHVCTQLKLNNVKVVHARAEDAGQDLAHREQYDLVVARSVAHMPILMEYLLPLCKIGGQIIAMKGESAAAEARLAENAMRILGGRLSRIVPIELPHVAETHYLVLIDKIAATPGRYPRKPGLPSKNPL